MYIPFTVNRMFQNVKPEFQGLTFWKPRLYQARKV